MKRSKVDSEGKKLTFGTPEDWWTKDGDKSVEKLQNFKTTKGPDQISIGLAHIPIRKGSPDTAGNQRENATTKYHTWSSNCRNKPTIALHLYNKYK